MCEELTWICPVCKGKGTLFTKMSNLFTLDCFACKGTGSILFSKLKELIKLIREIKSGKQKCDYRLR